jgi:hypothetical protein
LYLCTGNTNSSISLASTGVDTTLWHHGLGHMSEKGMKILHKINLLPDLKQIDLDFVSIVFMEKKESHISQSRKRKEE